MLCSSNLTILCSEKLSKERWQFVKIVLNEFIKKLLSQLRPALSIRITTIYLKIFDSTFFVDSERRNENKSSDLCLCHYRTPSHCNRKRSKWDKISFSFKNPINPNKFSQSVFEISRKMCFSSEEQGIIIEEGKSNETSLRQSFPSACLFKCTIWNRDDPILL